MISYLYILLFPFSTTFCSETPCTTTTTNTPLSWRFTKILMSSNPVTSSWNSFSLSFHLHFSLLMTPFLWNFLCIWCLINYILFIFASPHWLFSLSLFCWLPLLFHIVNQCYYVGLFYGPLGQAGNYNSQNPFSPWFQIRVAQKRNLHRIWEVELKPSHFSLNNFRARYGNGKTWNCLENSSLYFSFILSPLFLLFSCSVDLQWFQAHY